MRKLIISIALALLLVLIPVSGVLAETSQDVTVTATPAIVSISNLPIAWTMNDSTATTPGDDAIRKATTYYSNNNDNTAAPSDTVVDGECRFTVTNDGTVNVDIEISMSDFTGGTDPMTNGDSGSAGVGTFGAKAYVSGALLSAAPAITVAGTADVITDLPHTASNTKKWGLQVATQTDDFTDSTSTTSTVTLTATETP